MQFKNNPFFGLNQNLQQLVYRLYHPSLQLRILHWRNVWMESVRKFETFIDIFMISYEIITLQIYPYLLSESVWQANTLSNS